MRGCHVRAESVARIRGAQRRCSAQSEADAQSMPARYVWHCQWHVIRARSRCRSVVRHSRLSKLLPAVHPQGAFDGASHPDVVAFRLAFRHANWHAKVSPQTRGVGHLGGEQEARVAYSPQVYERKTCAAGKRRSERKSVWMRSTRSCTLLSQPCSGILCLRRSRTRSFLKRFLTSS